MTYTVNELASSGYKIKTVHFGTLQKAQEYMKYSSHVGANAGFVHTATEDIRVGVQYTGYYKGRSVGSVVLEQH